MKQKILQASDSLLLLIGGQSKPFAFNMRTEGVSVFVGAEE